MGFDMIKEVETPVRLTRVTPVGTRPHKGLFRCYCGNEFVAFEDNVRRGHTRSCGCLQSKLTKARNAANARHGHFAGNKPSPTYKSWQAMIARCTNPNHPAYHNYYHGTGITVCERWLNSFEAFLADMGERPEGRTLDRWPNNAGNYEPGNCRWATASEQSLNRRPRKSREAA